MFSQKSVNIPKVLEEKVQNLASEMESAENSEGAEALLISFAIVMQEYLLNEVKSKPALRGKLEYFQNDLRSLDIGDNLAVENPEKFAENLEQIKEIIEADKGLMAKMGVDWMPEAPPTFYEQVNEKFGEFDAFYKEKYPVDESDKDPEAIEMESAKQEMSSMRCLMVAMREYLKDKPQLASQLEEINEQIKELNDGLAELGLDKVTENWVTENPEEYDTLRDDFNAFLESEAETFARFDENTIPPRAVGLVMAL